MARIEELIDELEEYVNSCKLQTLSNTKITINKDELLEQIQEIRLRIPDEVQKCKRMYAQKDSIIENANARANEIIAQANAHVVELVSEHEIMQQAYEKANDEVSRANEQAKQIIDEATEEANNIRLSAINYTDESLANIQGILANGMNTLQEKYDSLIRSLNQSYETVVSNRAELAGSNSEEEEAAEFDMEDEQEFEDEE